MHIMCVLSLSPNDLLKVYYRVLLRVLYKLNNVPRRPHYLLYKIYYAFRNTIARTLASRNADKRHQTLI